MRDFATDYRGAIEAYAEIEGNWTGERILDIVLLGADSLDGEVDPFQLLRDRRELRVAAAGGVLIR